MWMEKALHIALGKERVEEIKLNYPIGLTLPAEACVTRWKMLFAGAAQSTVNLLIYSGTQKKILAMDAVCSQEGFVDQNTTWATSG